MRGEVVEEEKARGQDDSNEIRSRSYGILTPGQYEVRGLLLPLPPCANDLNIHTVRTANPAGRVTDTPSRGRTIHLFPDS